MKIVEAVELFYLSMDGVRSPKTITWYQMILRDLIAFLGDLPLSEITVHHLRRWRVQLNNRTELWADHQYKPAQSGTLSVETIRGYIRACRRFFTWCVEEEFLDKSPAARLEMPPKPERQAKGILPADRERIISVASANPRDHALVLFMADTGCRASGIVNLRIKDLSLHQRRAVVWEKGRGGNRKSRTVYYTSRAAAALAAWLVVRGDPKTDKVFTSRNHPDDGLTRDGVYQVLASLAEKGGVISGWNPHQWRHGLARTLLTLNLSLSEVSQILGHSTVQITGDIYGFINENQLQERYDRMYHP